MPAKLPLHPFAPVPRPPGTLQFSLVLYAAGYTTARRWASNVGNRRATAPSIGRESPTLGIADCPSLEMAAAGGAALHLHSRRPCYVVAGIQRWRRLDTVNCP